MGLSYSQQIQLFLQIDIFLIFAQLEEIFINVHSQPL